MKFPPDRDDVILESGFRVWVDQQGAGQSGVEFFGIEVNGSVKELFVIYGVEE
jgi:hypothetical protein